MSKPCYTYEYDSEHECLVQYKDGVKSVSMHMPLSDFIKLKELYEDQD